MELLSVYVDGYKNLNEVEIELSKLTALVSLNNLGKSNLLNALDYSIRFIKASSAIKESMMSDSSLFPLNKDLKDKDFTFIIKLAHDNLIIEYAYGFKWRKEIDQKPIITKESLRIKRNDSKQKFEQYLNRDNNKALYKKTISARCNESIVVEDNELVINKLIAYDWLFFREIIKLINDINFYTEASFDTKSYYDRDSVIRDLEEIDIDIHNIPQLLNLLKIKYPNKFELLKDSFMSLFSNIEDVIVISNEITKGKIVYSLLVKDKELDNTVSFEMMSDGSKRILLILTRLILASISNVSLIMIEEVENSVHPSLLISYLRIMDQLLDNAKILITSHSPYIISSLNLKSIYIGIKDKGAKAKFYRFSTKGSDRLTKEASHYDLSNGDYLFSLLSDEELDWSRYLENYND